MRLPTHLTDSQLIEGLKRCVARERGATAALVACLAEVDARRLHLAAGVSALFAYCCGVLHRSESATYNRIEVARAVRRCPTLLDRLAAGSLSLATARLLAPHLTRENHRELMEAAAGLGKRAVEELIARRFPRPLLHHRRRTDVRWSRRSHRIATRSASPPARPRGTSCDRPRTSCVIRFPTAIRRRSSIARWRSSSTT